MIPDDILLTAEELEYLKVMMADPMAQTVLEKCTNQLAQRIGAGFILADLGTEEGVRLATIMQAEVKALTGFWVLLQEKANSTLTGDKLVDFGKAAGKAPVPI